MSSSAYGGLGLMTNLVGACIARSAKLYASNERRNDVYGRMRTIAAKLTPTEVNGLAGYYRTGFK
jgi:hypothetical protein